MGASKIIIPILVLCLILEEVFVVATKRKADEPGEPVEHTHNLRPRKRQNPGGSSHLQEHTDVHLHDLHGKTLDLKNPHQKYLHTLYKPEHSTPTEHGMALLRNPDKNKGLAFTLYERQYLGIHGLLPPAFMTEELQAQLVLTKLHKLASNESKLTDEEKTELAMYIKLDDLQTRNEKLFYRTLTDNIDMLMPIVYTPTVGLACQEFGYLYHNPKGVYVTINDNDVSQIYQILSNWEHDDVRAIVVTDGERILGLGDLGADGMGIPIGKLALYVALGGIQPRWTLPVTIDVGTETKTLIDDPYYIGLKRPRERGEKYTELIDNFMTAVRKKYGTNVLVQFEDFGNDNAYPLLERYQEKKYCVFNDDIQGTAAVAVAGLLTAKKITGKDMKDTVYVFNGAGGAALGIAELIILQMTTNEKLSREEAYKRIYMSDQYGLITKDRQKGDKKFNPLHIPFAKKTPLCNGCQKAYKKGDLLQLVKDVKPGAIIGVSTAGGSFTEAIIKEMDTINKHSRPIIFAMSNPTKNSECTAEQAFKHTEGRVLFASGSPFKKVELKIQGKDTTYYPSQGNNAYIFPGVALGVILFKIATIDNKLFLLAAKTVAQYVKPEHIAEGRLYPKLQDIRELSIQIAINVAEACFKDGTAKLHPVPEDIELFIRSQIYNVEYEELINKTYDWPEADMKHRTAIPVGHHNSKDDQMDLEVK